MVRLSDYKLINTAVHIPKVLYLDQVFNALSINGSLIASGLLYFTREGVFNWPLSKSFLSFCNNLDLSL